MLMGHTKNLNAGPVLKSKPKDKGLRKKVMLYYINNKIYIESWVRENVTSSIVGE